MFCLTPFAASPQSTRSISSAWELVFAQFRKQRLAVAFDALWAHSINLREFAHGPRLASCNLQQRRVLQDAVCGPSILARQIQSQCSQPLESRLHRGAVHRAHFAAGDLPGGCNLGTRRMLFSRARCGPRYFLFPERRPRCRRPDRRRLKNGENSFSEVVDNFVMRLQAITEVADRLWRVRKQFPQQVIGKMLEENSSQ